MLPRGQRHPLGYIIIRTGVNKKELEHRVVMERHLGRKLKNGEVVHHINEVRDDNRIENLQLCSSSGRHVADHHRELLFRR